MRRDVLPIRAPRSSARLWSVCCASLSRLTAGHASTVIVISRRRLARVSMRQPSTVTLTEGGYEKPVCICRSRNGCSGRDAVMRQPQECRDYGCKDATRRAFGRRNAGCCQTVCERLAHEGHRETSHHHRDRQLADNGHGRAHHRRLRRQHDAARSQPRVSVRHCRHKVRHQRRAHGQSHTRPRRSENRAYNIADAQFCSAGSPSAIIARKVCSSMTGMPSASAFCNLAGPMLSPART